MFRIALLSPFSYSRKHKQSIHMLCRYVQNLNITIKSGNGSQFSKKPQILQKCFYTFIRSKYTCLSHKCDVKNFF